ncbi:hypothetical protein STAQ_44040 [Allostella sp. ATCC 35155]|nr:hypothetical protein STAQ_44040 [Stella sp. ATCC 35155]
MERKSQTRNGGRWLWAGALTAVRQAVAALGMVTFAALIAAASFRPRPRSQSF